MMVNKMLRFRASAWNFFIIMFFDCAVISATLPPLVYGHQFAKKRVQLSGQQDPLTLGIQMIAILALMN